MGLDDGVGGQLHMDGIQGYQMNLTRVQQTRTQKRGGGQMRDGVRVHTGNLWNGR